MNYRSLVIAAVVAWVIDSMYGFLVFGKLMKDSICSYPCVAVPPSSSIVYVFPTTRFMEPPAGTETPSSFTPVVELRFCEMRCST